MPPQFGTSGLRGPVSSLTPKLVSDYALAFATCCPIGTGVYIGQDLRPSSPDIADVLEGALREAGIDVTSCGAVPTPALALAASSAGAAAIMVTGSHIPADRNGLKFYTPDGEITKSHEAAILARLRKNKSTSDTGSAVFGTLRHDPDCGARYIDRYVKSFGAHALDGLRIGIYEHSSVARDLLNTVVRAVGGKAVPLARSNTFIPVDTEAMDPATREQMKVWVHMHKLDAIISTDGDADRPMLVDEKGQLVPGDVLGPLSAQALAAAHVVTPVSSNTLVEEMALFEQIERTRIGSPFVIAAMEAALTAAPMARIVGYEANGGFMLGFTAQGPVGAIDPLMTRDCLLPLLAALSTARAQGLTVSALTARLPKRFTASDRIRDIAPPISAAFLSSMRADPMQRTSFFAPLNLDLTQEKGIDLTDGLRISFETGDVVHFRPSGNAPEFRCYVESATYDRAQQLLMGCLSRLVAALER